MNKQSWFELARMNDAAIDSAITANRPFSHMASKCGALPAVTYYYNGKLRTVLN